MAQIGSTGLYHKSHSRRSSVLGYILILCYMCGVLSNEVKVLQVIENSDTPLTIGNLATESNPGSANKFSVINPTPDSAVEGIPGVTLEDLFDFQESGDVVLKTPLDREQKDSYSLLVETDSGEYYVVEIRVLDLNDNAPSFNPSVRNVTVSELADVDHQISILGSATDGDLGSNSTQRYEIISGSNGVFKLDLLPIGGSELSAVLKLNQKVDYESQTSYQLVVRAYDGLNRTGDLLVNVAVQDVNDIAPEFEQSEYTASVFENASIGEKVLTVKATDPEEGNNGIVKYSLSSEDSSPNYDHFAIDRDSGDITVRHRLNYITQPSYRLRVIAENPDTAQKSSSAVVSIQVSNVNDQAPTITVDYLFDRKLSEDQATGTNIARLSIADPDQDGGSFTVELSDTGGTFALTQTDSDTFYITLNKMLDRENVPFYNLTITAWDGGSPPLSTTSFSLIEVGDVNDNAPQFSQTEYTLTVQEMVNIGAPVGSVPAEDPDEGDNSLITYTLLPIEGGSSDWFAVRNSSGMIVTAREPIVCSTDFTPRFYIQAEDHGTPSKSAQVLVHVQITDVDNNQPVFDRGFYSASISEERNIGSQVIQVTASDDDCGLNSVVKYSLSAQGVTAPPEFRIDSDTGSIYLAQLVDFETRKIYEFPVMAVDKGGVGLVGSVNVKVTVTDANDNVPVFDSLTYPASVRYDNQPGDTLVVVKATDEDSGVRGDVTYSIVSGNSDNYFRVDARSGAVKLQSTITASAPDSFTLLIRAMDGMGENSEGMAEVSISVIRNSAQAPRFGEQLYQFTVAENTEDGQTIGTVTANVGGDSSGITYSMSGNHLQYFTITPSTGDIKTTQTPLDREQFGFILLSVLATKGDVVGSAQINVSITDVNDNSPEFVSSVTVLPVPEDQEVNVPIYPVLALDDDSGDYGRVSYQLTQNLDSMFSVDPVSGQISLKKPLDYETRSNLTLTVRAYDAGDPAKSTNLDITVEVQDINDNEPTFSQSEYDLSLNESMPALSRVGLVTASDRDSGQNGKIHYRIQERQDVFGIFPSTGQLYNEYSFSQLEVREPYTVHVIATDNGSPKRSATCTVNINIRDENDNIPRFTQSVFELRVAEGTLPGKDIGSISATDVDSGDNSRLAYSIPSDVTAFRINKNTGKLYVKSTIDRETNPRFEFSVSVADSGTPSHTSHALVKIAVSDVNDNSPEFNGLVNGVIPAYVYEKRDNGTLILQVTAEDSDEGENRRVTYNIIGAEAANFVIDPLSGWIRSRISFDRSQKSVYNITVRARDSGNPSLSTNAVVMVRVLDNNDPPRFSASYLNLETGENIPIGTEIGRIHAYDGNQQSNARINYTVLSSNPENAFGINTSTGAVYSVLPVDYESIKSHWMLVQTVDNSQSNPQPTNINVTVKILDRNDNVPIFTKDPTWINIVENTTIGEVIGQVTAHDVDTGPNGEVVYEIVSQYPRRPESMFSINPKMGTVSTAKVVDYENTSMVMLIVKATDQALNLTERTYSTMTIVINIEDINDNYPKFKSRDRISVAEDEAVNFPLLVVAATDADKNSSVRYTIQSGNTGNKFNLNSVTGELKLNGELDRETQAEYNLVVKAIDTGTPPNHANQTIHITVTDVNDNPPRFTNRTYTAHVREEQSGVIVVLQVTATDPDEGINSRLEYFIPQGLADDMFTLDNSGVIRASRPLDRERKAQYTFSAYVRDGAFPALYDWCTVTVHVTDTNDHTPYFQHREFFQTVPENIREGNTSIFQVVAQDDDEGDNARISYSIIDVTAQKTEVSPPLPAGNDGNKFSIDSNTGRIYAQSLDREEQERYTLIIQASDNGSTEKKNQTRVIITVSDTNDNDPVFTNSGRNYQVSLNETVEPGSYVTTIAAQDPDKGNNSKITYYISSNGTDGRFTLDMDTGVIRTSLVSGHFDREKKSFYSFKVTAQDGAQYDPRTKQAWVDVTILDVNDNAPVFTEVPFVKSITGFASIEQTVLTVRAEDKDLGPNSEIVYSIVETEGQEDYFKINSGTGDIKVKRSLVGLSGVQLIKIRATDRGDPPLYGDGYVQIHVGSTTGQQTFKFDNSTYTVHLDENAADQDLVLRLRASHNGGVNEEVVYSLSGDVAETNNPFIIGAYSGEIRVADTTKLDYEFVKRYRIVVVALSGDYTDYCTVWVNIRDVNDNDPVFTHNRYVGIVGEQANLTTYITRVLATDEDSTENGEVEYRLQGPMSSYLNVGSKSGIVTLAQRIDREANEQIRVTVIAQDKGNPPRSSSSILRITVIDENDNPPTFTNLPRTRNDPVFVKEDMQVGDKVYIVSALDPDTAPPVTYAFTEGGNPNHTFSLDYITGRITLARPLDHERIQSYLIGIRASDSEHVVERTLFVSVTDENDNAPIFKQNNYERTIQELLPPDTPVIRVEADDLDSGLNGRITYTLQGTGASDFYINATSGWIYNRGSVEYSPDRATINLAIKATDGGVPELSALVFVQIHIQDINNYAPVFSSMQSYTKSVSEEEATGVTILSVSATDNDDSPNNKRITFSIIDGDPEGVFSMENQEPNVGNIVLKSMLDRETKDRYTLVILAADGGDPPKNTSTTVNITVSDFNDWTPVFSDITAMGADAIPVIKTTVAENITAGSDILVVHATDNDIGDNAAIEYMITSGNDNGLFQINQQTGLISLAPDKVLDYDTKQNHRMQVRAADTGVPRKSALATVDIAVEDVNDNKPYFPRLMYLETVKEKQPSGTYVFTAQAVDKDAGIYGNLTYTLVGADSAYYRIDKETGEVTTAVEFTIAGKQTYLFNVSAVDPGYASAVVQVQVRILKYDEHKPVFNQSAYTFTINEVSRAYVGMIVGQVFATDLDTDSDGVVAFFLAEESFYFNVSRDDGIIRIKRPLTDKKKFKRDLSARFKRSVSEKETLTIQACSGRLNEQCQTTTVTIEIPGAADLTPQPQESGGVTSQHIIIIAVVVAALVIIVVVVVIVVKTMRNCRKTKDEPQAPLTQQSHLDSLGRTADYGRVIPGGMGPPPYASYPQYAPASHDMTDRSQCASSGRGSAEFDEEGDEEITAINTVPLHVHQRIKMMPDSGIQRDADTISEHSARDHQEYLARLGIDPKKIGGNEKKGLAQSVESMHQFSDEGGGEADPLDITNLYNKLEGDGGAETADEAGGENNINQMGFGEAPAQIGSLSSVTDANEEFTGSYNWDYLLNWGPQFQPLADVFAEIARLKDETIQPKRKPIQTIPQTGSVRTTTGQPLKLGGPPPIITATPPRVESHRDRRDMANMSSARTSQLTSMVSLPHSPISHESSFSNLAFSPNFTPALSPLATRSPSVSTLQSNTSRSRSTQGSRLGQQGHPMHRQSSNAGNDLEYRI